MVSPIANQIDTDGFAVLESVYAQDQVTEILEQLEGAIAADQAGSALRVGGGLVYAARNIPALWPPVKEIWKQPQLLSAIHELLGPNAGLVRVLYFDKPPGRSWALPWHKDMAIAVRDNRLPSSRFKRPTTKSGVPHVEAPQELLDNMLTARIHLDDVTDENGPLQVIPGSHRGQGETRQPQTILARAGNVLIMRPLLSHCSGGSLPHTNRHRRILHLEFAGTAVLPDGYAWHDFLR